MAALILAPRPAGFTQVDWEVHYAAETCDGDDNDLDGFVDEGLGSYADGDGFGDPEVTLGCELSDEGVMNRRACDDGDPTIKPQGEERCDELDSDCDGQVDEGMINNYYLDEDQDGYGGEPVQICEPGDEHARREGDCDDNDPDVSPGADELCADGVDNDCDGTADEAECVNGPRTMYTYWEGVEILHFGFSPEVDFECRIIWTTIGVPSKTACPDCLFVFDVELELSETSTIDEEECGGRYEQSLSFTYGFMEDYYYGESNLAYYWGYEWYGLAWAALDEDGTLIFYYAYSGPYTDYETYFYSNYYFRIAYLYL